MPSENLEFHVECSREKLKARIEVYSFNANEYDDARRRIHYKVRVIVNMNNLDLSFDEICKSGSDLIIHGFPNTLSYLLAINAGLVLASNSSFEEDLKMLTKSAIWKAFNSESINAPFNTDPEGRAKKFRIELGRDDAEEGLSPQP